VDVCGAAFEISKCLLDYNHGPFFFFFFFFFFFSEIGLVDFA
jgi:hypothetical protein